MAKQIIGYILLVAGLVIIIGTLWQSFMIFTNKASAPLVFKTSAVFSSVKTGNDFQSQIINMAVQQQLSQMLSPESITKILNLASWSILAGVLIFGGGVISSIGTKLLK